jgi:hypothetical protein
MEVLQNILLDGIWMVLSECSRGGRRIVACDRWLNGEDGRTGIECFLLDVGEPPSIHHSLDRIDNDGPYDPANDGTSGSQISPHGGVVTLSLFD